MEIPLQVTLHGVRASDALHEAIRQKADRLERFYGRITSCRVAISLDGLQRRKGKQYGVRIELKVPGGAIASTHAHDEELQVALRDAFDAARRQLEEHARIERGDVKQHATD